MAKKKVTKISPYREFRDWLLNPMPNKELPMNVIKAINPRSVLCMFGNLHGVSIFLNEYFNTFDVMALPQIEFYKFLKDIVHKHNITPRDFSFYYSEKHNKSLKELNCKFPFLKRHELSTFLEDVKDDPEAEALYESLGLNKYKSKKLTKKEKKELNGQIESSKQIQPPQTDKGKPQQLNSDFDIPIKTFNDLKNCFSV